MKQAKWIWAHGEDRADEYVWFYRSFSCTGKPISMEISCDSNYELYVNGRLAGFGQFADYPHAKVYDQIDLSAYCHERENQLAILVWYMGVDSSCYWKGLPGLLYEITEDGAVCAASDRQTLCRIATDYVSGRQKWITGQLGLSYTYDAGGYKGFCPADCHEAVEVSGRPLTLYPRPNEKIVLHPFAPAELVDSQRQIYDMGCESVGYLGVRVRAPGGTKLSISYGEHLVTAEDGAEVVPRFIGSRDFSVDLIGNGEWVDFSNYMRRLGCRYLQVSCEAPVEIDAIGLYPTEYPLTVLPFDAGDPLRQKIYDTCVRTLRLCMFEHYEDCPWREQSLYHLDSRNQMLCGYYAFGEYAFARSSLWLFGQDRSDTGLLHICSPSRGDLYIPFFSLIYILQMEEYARYSGDDSLLRELYPKLREILQVFLDRMEDGLIPNLYGDARYWNFYEWNPTLQGHLRREDEKQYDLVLCGAVSLALQSMARIAQRLERPTDSTDYFARAQKLNEQIHRAFFSEEKGLYQTIAGQECYSQVGNAFVILSGAARGEIAERVCRAMTEDVTMTAATLSMRGFVYDALLAVNRERYAPYILSEIDRDYGYMLSQGATSFWETIQGAEAFHNAGSLCHGWSAIPIVYYHRLLR